MNLGDTAGGTSSSPKQNRNAGPSFIPESTPIRRPHPSTPQTQNTDPDSFSRLNVNADELFGDAEEMMNLDDDDLYDEDGGMEPVDPSWEMIARMRTWRHDAIHQHLYETAAFWGDKIFTWTGEPNDAFWLAQAHFLMGHYLRAEKILTGPLPPSRMPRLGKNDRDGEDAATDLKSKGKGKGRAGLRDFSMIGAGEALTEWSMPCKYLAALCMVHQERFTDALELIGESNPFSATGKSHIRSETGDLKMEASLCRLRGVLYLRLNSLQMAKECYMEALSLDVRNYDVFNELVNEMMSPEEEWDFIQSLSYREQLEEEDAAFVKLVYTSRLNKTMYGKQIRIARRKLADEYNLSTNSDIWVAAAEDLFAKYKYEECYLITSRIIVNEPGHAQGLPLHLACLAQIPRLSSSLFMLAHKLVEQEPTSPISWYAVGLWYFLGERYAEARRYFAATHDEDTRFAPAWIAFAHCFAYENEHEHAITAYSTTARLFPGSYFPHVCIGMEHLHLNNLELAKESFELAQKMNPSDPLLLNELGVCAYNRGDYEAAVKHYEAAIQGSKKMQGVASDWAVTYNNLGHAYRRLDQPSNAARAYSDAIKLNALNISALTSLGMLAHEEGDVTTAIERYHQALAIETTDPIATFLLEKALKEQVEEGACRFDGLPVGLTDLDLDPFAFGEEARGGMLTGMDYPGHQAMGQNRLLDLPPFPNYGKMAAQREIANARIDALFDEAYGSGPFDGEGREHGDGSTSTDEGEDGEEEEDEDRSEERAGDNSADYDEADEDNNTAMSVSMNMSVSMEEEDGDEDGSLSAEEPSRSRSRVGEGSTMDLE
ncbi:cell division control protein 16 [Filobasidium floriforme]|uniref:cell division control protein 16 n=1 Tax=Filobasidium floriforme TaxID=5210 RepID=UPI001E8D6B3B|nr:cell division control protein 16 [Filobasidium floriforme]KAH8090448.1 cell division control protein 16 [Filobasidium floriforme]